MNHRQEWQNSGVDEQLINLNVTALEGTSPLDYLLYSKKLPRRNDGRVNNSILRRYEHTKQGGWWCSGVDLLTGSEDLWGCFKPNFPRMSYDERKLIKYEHPPKTSAGIFALRVPLRLWQQLAQRHHQDFTLDKINNQLSDLGFWQWIINHPSIPLCITEGAKKAGALLTAGYAAIALPGVNNGYRTPRDKLGNRIGKTNLIPQLKKLAVSGRKIYIAFDQDSKPSAIKATNSAIRKLGSLFTQAGCQVNVIVWSSKSGKGVDDFLASKGIESFDKVYEKALPLTTWKVQSLSQLTYPSDIELNTRYLEDLSIPATASLIGIKSPIGTGKTKALEKIVEQAVSRQQKILVIGHRIKLVEQLCQRFKIPYLTDINKNNVKEFKGCGLCIDSLHPNSLSKFNPSDWANGLIIIDEVEQVLWHVLNSNTCKKNRVSILRSFKKLLEQNLESQGKIVVSDADLSDVSLDYLISLIGIKFKPFIITNNWKPRDKEAWMVHNYSEVTPREWLKDLVQHIQEGGKPFVCLSAQKLTSKWGTQTLEFYLKKRFPEIKILRIDSESLTDPNHDAYQSINYLNKILLNYDIILASPSIETGISIDVKNHFTSVWGLFQGIQAATSVCQSLGRIRDNIPRYLWCASYGFNTVGNGSTSIPNLLTSSNRVTQLNIKLLQQSDLEALDDIDIEFQAESLLCWAKMAVRVNASMIHYRESILRNISNKNHLVFRKKKLVKIKDTKAHKKYLYDNSQNSHQLIKAIESIREQNYYEECLMIARGKEITDQQYQILNKRLVKTAVERHNIRKYNLQKRYCIEVTPQLVALDNEGWYNKIRLHYFLTLGRSYLTNRDTIFAKKFLEEGQGSLFVPDFNGSQLGGIIGTMEVLGIPVLLMNHKRKLKPTDEDLQAMARIAIKNRAEIKTITGIGIAKNSSPITIIRRLLDKIGYGLTCIGSQKVDKKRVRVYQVVLPSDARQEIFRQWWIRDEKSPGSSESWIEEYTNSRLEMTGIQQQENKNYIQLSLEL
ncbi:plasmid replication protein, CyRepA1 family [Cyanobacterium sp. uoEpiScrs1]|uniref:plasmid replication protein, CyRepA1 family n=1 Tax=Cyanobacterium sp. uoEpiScrs1 TaxID=2976343 RepID=UPI00226A4920|nr:plasmid replication protein, CyRepA1 family [Cyanobacterium sp. uoEpiScrs1]